MKKTLTLGKAFCIYICANGALKHLNIKNNDKKYKEYHHAQIINQTVIL